MTILNSHTELFTDIWESHTNRIADKNTALKPKCKNKNAYLRNLTLKIAELKY